MPAVAGVCPPNEYETFESQQVASDCLWSDPARDNQVGWVGGSRVCHMLLVVWRGVWGVVGCGGVWDVTCEL